MKYRAEVDGLRALAVVPVILFHAEFEWFSGGFVGVDVFFVISGYLITKIIIEDIENNRFSIAKFYERRARRILPALFFVMLLSIPFAWMWMLPSEMKDFSESLVAVSFFSSNILFWLESGYFDTAVEEKPLLHTWSLAVEEQYYVLFPIFLILAWRFGKDRVFWTIVVMAAISLLLSEWGWRNMATANFYLAPTRVWELLAGSLAAFIVHKRGVQENNLLALLGLAAIVFSIFAYDETTPFPSRYALVPVLGSVLLVLYAKKGTIAAKFLSTKAFVGIGLISYSAYVLHQPILAFARIKSRDEPSQLLMAVLALCSLGLAYLSWRFIEAPFRDAAKINIRKLFVFSLGGIVFFSTFGLIVYNLNGNFVRTTFPPNVAFESLASRISNEGMPCDWSAQFNESVAYDGCVFGDDGSSDNVVLIGDSHSQALSYKLDQWASSSKKRVFWLRMNGCEYFPNVVRSRKVPSVDCAKNHSDLTAFISSLNADVILAFRWTLRMYPIDDVDLDMPYRNSFGDVESDTYREYFIYEDGSFLSTSEAKRQFLSDYVASVAEAARTLFLIYPVPETAINIFDRNDQYWRDNDEVLSEIFTNKLDYERRNEFVKNVFQGLKGTNIVHVRPSEIFCDYQKCYMQRNGIPFYLDDDHLGDDGARLIVNEIRKTYQ